MEEKLIVALSADIKDLQAKLREAQGVLKKFGEEAGDTVNKQKNPVDGLTRQITQLAAAYISLQAAINAVGKAFDTSLRLDSAKSALEAIFNSTEIADAQFSRLSDLAERLGLDLLTLTESYKSFAGSAVTAGMSLEQTNKIFESVSKASAVLKLSSEQTRGALLALSQMISKGTVQAEELRGQLAERLPGAFALAAKAMGVTTMELGKMLENGEVLASDLLPKLANELDKAYGDKIKGKVQGLQAEVARLNNTFTEAVDKGMIGKFFSHIVRGANESVSEIERLGKAVSSGRFMELLEKFFTLGHKGGNKAFDAQTAYLKSVKETTDALRLNAETQTDLDAKLVSIQAAMGNNISATALSIQAYGDQSSQVKKLNSDYEKLAKQLKVIDGMIIRPPKIVDPKISNERDLRSMESGGIPTGVDAHRLPWELKKPHGIESGTYSAVNDVAVKEMEAYIANAELLTQLIGTNLTGAMADAMMSGEDMGKALANTFKRLIAQMISAVAVAATLSALLAIFAPGASAAVGGFSGILKGLTGINIGGGNKSVNAPSFADTGGSGEVTFRISGDALEGVMKNYNNRMRNL